jgi:tetratricopeptide (TPR) repeat protein
VSRARFIGPIVAALLVLVVLGTAGAQTSPSPGGQTSGTVEMGTTTSRVIDVGPESNANSFDQLWSAYKLADDNGDADGAAKALADIRWFRIERNIHSLDDIALALVGHGQARLRKGERAKAEEDFRNAVSLDPHLPDAYYGLAKAKLKSGPMGFFSAWGDVASAFFSRTSTAQGGYFLFVLLTATTFVALLGLAATFALVMIVRHGALLLHDVEEALGAGSRPVATGVFAVFLLVPVMTLQGYGWLPLWWIALLFLYLSVTEKVIGGLLVALTLGVGPVDRALEGYAKAQQNPLLRASFLATEGGPDARAIADLLAASTASADDRDLRYLLALQYKKTGRYDDAAAIYREIVDTGKDPIDLTFALNNLGNIEFARGKYGVAISRYKKAAELHPPTDMEATAYYNLSLAHLQGFEYEPTNAARGRADELNRSLTAQYDALWKADRRGSAVAAVVDLAPSRDEVWAKFIDKRDGVGKKNLAGRGANPLGSINLASSVLNRFTGFVVLFGIVILGMARWRGDNSYTARCPKCGTPFCKKCQLAASASGLCTQCHHLFVVRDGVSGPARNRKIQEVQDEEHRRSRVFRVLSLLLPGAGQIYGQATLVGLALNLVWFTAIALLVLEGRVVPLTETPAPLAGYWGTGFLLFVMLVVYVLANRLRPGFEFVIPAQPRASRRMPQAQAS